MCAVSFFHQKQAISAIIDIIAITLFFSPPCRKPGRVWWFENYMLILHFKPKISKSSHHALMHQCTGMYRRKHLPDIKKARTKPGFPENLKQQ